MNYIKILYSHPQDEKIIFRNEIERIWHQYKADINYLRYWYEFYMFFGDIIMAENFALRICKKRSEMRLILDDKFKSHYK